MLPISGNRITLQNIQAADLEDFLAYRQDPEVCKYQGFNPMSREKCEAFIKEMNGLQVGVPGKWKQIGIWSQQHNKLIGDCAIVRKEHEPRLAEIGCTLNSEFQGQGLAREAVTVLVDNLFTNFDLHKIIADMDARNQGAIGLIVRLGFSKEAHYRQHFFDENDNQWIDEVVYGMLREDW